MAAGFDANCANYRELRAQKFASIGVIRVNFPSLKTDARLVTGVAIPRRFN